MRSVLLQIPARPEFVRVARMAIAAAASCAGFTVDQIDEIKQSVGEACSNAVSAVHRSGGTAVTLHCYLDDEGICIEVSPVIGLSLDSGQEDEHTSFQYLLIKTLMDDVEILKTDDGVESVRFRRSLSA